MSFHQGQGGSATANGHTLNIRTWEMTKKRDRAEVTHSGSAGYRNRVPTLKDTTGRFSLPWDSAATPESLGFSEGADVAVIMTLGDSGLSYALASVIIGELTFKVDNAQGVVELDVMWEGNGPVTGPA